MGLESQDCYRGALQVRIDSLCDSLEYLKCLILCQKTLCCRLTRYEEILGSDQRCQRIVCFDTDVLNSLGGIGKY